MAGDASDGVARIDVLQADRRARFVEGSDDGIAQERPDVAVLDVARGIALAVRGHEILARPLGDDDHRMAATLQPLPQRGEQLLEREGDLGDRAKFTWPSTSTEYAAMNPESRPISFTRPMPLRAPSASALAA